MTCQQCSVLVCTIRLTGWGQMISCPRCFPLNSWQSRKCLSLPIPEAAQAHFDPCLTPAFELKQHTKQNSEKIQKVICGGNDTYLKRKPQGVGGVKVFRRRLYLSSQIKSHRRTKKGKIVLRAAPSRNVSVIWGHCTKILVRFLQDHERGDAWEN